MIAYLIVFSLLDMLSQKFQIYPGVVAWYPPDGVSFSFLISFGPWFVPVAALASIISSSIIFHFAAPLGPLLVWAAILSISYGIIAYFLRLHRTKTAKKLSVRSMLVWMVFAFIVVTFLAIISVANLMQFGLVPKSDAFNATIAWWIGEMIGLLVFTPFLLFYVMPWIIRFSEGKRVLPKRRKLGYKVNPEGIAQAVSMLLILYLVFGVQSLQQFHLHYLVAIPLIWVAMRMGFKRTTFAIVLTNFGIMFSVWLFKYQHSQLAEYQFMMFGVYFSVLIIGIIVFKQKESETEIRKKEIHNRALIENAPDGIILMAADRSVKYRSPSTQRLLGYKEEDPEGAKLALLTHPDDALALRDLFNKLLLAPGSMVTSQYRIKHQDGSWRWLESTFTNQLSNPNLEAVVINFRDITERKLAEEALSQNERRFRALVEQSQEEISLLTADGILTYESPNSRRPLGYLPGENIGKGLFDLFHPDDRDGAIQLFQMIVQNPGMIKKAIFRVRHQNGSYLWMEGYISNLLDDPDVQSVVINYADVTERIEKEQEIAVLAKIPSESPNPVLRMSQEGFLLYANETSNGIQELWHCTIGEMVPKYMVDIAAVAFARHENIPVEIVCDEKVFSITVTPILETGYINLYGRDITKRVRAEESLKVSNNCDKSQP